MQNMLEQRQEPQEGENSAWVYFARCGNGAIKIGSTTDIRRRFWQLYDVKPEFLFGFLVWGNNPRSVESAFHAHFRTKRRPVTHDYYDLSEREFDQAKSLKLWRLIPIPKPFPNHKAHYCACECHPRTDYKRFERYAPLMGRVWPRT